MRFTVQHVFTVVILGTQLLTASCQYAEIIDVVHEGTQDLPGRPGLSSQKLAKYRLGGVVCVPRVTHLDYQTSKVDFLAYSDTLPGRPVTIKRAVLRSAEGAEIARMNGERGMAMVPDGVDKSLFVGGTVLFGRLQDAVLMNSPQLDLVLTIAIGEEQSDITYRLEQRIRKYRVQR